MIKQRNMGDFLIELTIPGAQTTTASASSGAASAVAPFNGRISAILARLATQGTTGTQTVDLLQNGSSLTGSSGVLNFPTTVGKNAAPTYTTANLTSNPVKVSKGDVITVVNTTVHSTPAIGLTVYLNVERQRSASFNDAMQTDTIGSDSDII